MAALPPNELENYYIEHPDERPQYVSRGPSASRTQRLSIYGRSKNNSNVNNAKNTFLDKLMNNVLTNIKARLNEIKKDPSLTESQKNRLGTLIRSLRNRKSTYHNILKLHLLYILSSDIFQDVSTGLKKTLNEYNINVTEETRHIVRQLPRRADPSKTINSLTHAPLPEIESYYEGLIDQDIENEFKPLLINNGRRAAAQSEPFRNDEVYKDKIQKIINSLEKRLRTTHNPDDITLQNYYRLFSNKLRLKLLDLIHTTSERKAEMINYALTQVDDSYKKMFDKYEIKRQEYADRRAELIEQGEPASILATVLIVLDNVFRDTAKFLYTEASKIKQNIAKKVKNSNSKTKKNKTLNNYESNHYRKEKEYFNASGLSLFFSENPNILTNATILFPIIIDIIKESDELRMGIPSYLKDILNHIAPKTLTRAVSDPTTLYQSEIPRIEELQNFSSQFKIRGAKRTANGRNGNAANGRTRSNGRTRRKRTREPNRNTGSKRRKGANGNTANGNSGSNANVNTNGNGNGMNE